MKKHLPRVIFGIIILGCTIYQNFITTLTICILLILICCCFWKGSRPYLLLIVLMIRLAIFQHGVTLDYTYLWCRHSGQEIDITLDWIVLPTTPTKYTFSWKFWSLLIDTYVSSEQKLLIDSHKKISLVATIYCLWPWSLLPYSYESHLFSLGVRGVISKIYSMNQTFPTSTPNHISTLLPKNPQFINILPSANRVWPLYTSPSLTSNTFPILAWIIWWDTTWLPKSTYRDFIDSWLVHLISASWWNIIMVLVLSSYVLFFVPIRYRKYIQIILVMLYAYGVGENISFLRALLAYLCVKLLIPPWFKPYKYFIVITSILCLFLYNPILLIASWWLLLSVAWVFWLTYVPHIFPYQHKPILSQLIASCIAMFTLTWPLLLLTWKINILSPFLTILASPLISCIFFSYIVYIFFWYTWAVVYLVWLLEKLAHRGATSWFFLVVALPPLAIYVFRIWTRILLVIIYYRTRKQYFAYDTRD